MINIFEGWRETRSIKNTQKQLHRLSDHMLADIGLTRSDIASIGIHGRVRRSDR